MALSVSHASSKAVSKTTSVCGSNEEVWNPRMLRPYHDVTDPNVTECLTFVVKLAEFVTASVNRA